MERNVCVLSHLVTFLIIEFGWVDLHVLYQVHTALMMYVDEFYDNSFIDLIYINTSHILMTLSLQSSNGQLFVYKSLLLLAGRKG